MLINTDQQINKKVLTDMVKLLKSSVHKLTVPRCRKRISIKDIDLNKVVYGIMDSYAGLEGSEYDVVVARFPLETIRVEFIAGALDEFYDKMRSLDFQTISVYERTPDNMESVVKFKYNLAREVEKIIDSSRLAKTHNIVSTVSMHLSNDDKFFDRTVGQTDLTDPEFDFVLEVALIQN